MDPRQLFIDERYKRFCAFCGSQPSTADHVPPRVFLDKPYPEDMRVVGACADCNSGSSADEEYLACFLECVVCGSTVPEHLQREKVRRALAHSPALAQRIGRGSARDHLGILRWEIEEDRARRIIIKMARGLIEYEEALPQLDEPERVWFRPLVDLTADQRDGFEVKTPSGMVLRWPEVGSRAFLHAAKTGEADPWRIVQPDRFRYRVVDGVEVRMVLREYLACVVAW